MYKTQLIKKSSLGLQSSSKYSLGIILPRINFKECTISHWINGSIYKCCFMKLRWILLDMDGKCIIGRWASGSISLHLVFILFESHVLQRPFLLTGLPSCPCSQSLITTFWKAIAGCLKILATLWEFVDRVSGSIDNLSILATFTNGSYSSEVCQSVLITRLQLHTSMSPYFYEL